MKKNVDEVNFDLQASTIIQLFIERKIESTRDKTLKCGSSITIAMPKLVLIPARHLRKR